MIGNDSRKPDIPRKIYADIHRLVPIVCVDCVVLVEDKILLIKRKYEPMQNEWWFPGGRLLKGEYLESAAPRIVKMETGVDVRFPVMLSHDETLFEEDPFGHNFGTHTINFVFAAKAAEMSMMKVALDDDHEAYQLFSLDEIMARDFNLYIKKFAALANIYAKKTYTR